MKPRLGEYLMTLAAIVAIAALFAVPWYGDPARSGWSGDGALRWPILAAAALGLGAALAQVARRGAALAVVLDLIGMLVAGVTTIVLAIHLATTAASLRAGAYVGVVAVAALTLGAYRAMRVEQGWTPGPGHEVQLVVPGADPPSAESHRAHA